MKLYIIFLTCILNHLNVFSQDTIQGLLKYKVERNYFHQMPSGKKELYSSKSFSATLFYKNKETLYKEITNENLTENQESRLSTGAVTIIPANVDMIQSLVYKNYQDSTIYYSFSPVQGRLGNFLKDTLRAMKWESTVDEKLINKRKCTKYILKSFFNSDWTAWIDLSLPFEEGPWRFKNLPGLIVELSADNDTQKYSLLEISMGTKISNENLYPLELKTAKIYNKTEYEKIEKDKKERVRLIMEQNNKQSQQQ